MPKGATPRAAWDALKGKGVSRTEIYAKIREKGKAPVGDVSTINDPNWGKIGTNLIKLNRNYFKVYTFRNNFEDIVMEEDEEMTNFDDVLKLAKEQDGYSKKNDVTYEVY